MSEEIIRCDMTGKTEDSAGVKSVAVEISEGLRLEVVPYRKTVDGNYVQGVLSTEGVKLIKAAAEKLRKSGWKPESEEAAV